VYFRGLSFPACKAHASYYSVICGQSGSTIFFDIISYKARYPRKVIKHKMCLLIFSTTFVWNSYSKGNSSRYCHKCTSVFMLSNRCSCEILKILEFSGHIFEKYSNTKFNENPPFGSRVVPCSWVEGQTDRWTDITNFAASRKRLKRV
jgi:hypothetical protein